MQRLEVSGAVLHVYMSLGGKGLTYRSGFISNSDYVTAMCD
jgi:hypothetical protein